MEENGMTEDLKQTGSQLSWLERAPDKREVGGSNPLEPTNAHASMCEKCSLKTEQKRRNEQIIE